MEKKAEAEWPGLREPLQQGHFAKAEASPWRGSREDVWDAARLCALACHVSNAVLVVLMAQACVLSRVRWRPMARSAYSAAHFESVGLILGTAACLELAQLLPRRLSPPPGPSKARKGAAQERRKQLADLELADEDSKLLLGLYVLLIGFYTAMAWTDLLVLEDTNGRPLYTLRYIEWSLAVPVLMVLVRRQQRNPGLGLEHGLVKSRWASPAIGTTVLYIWASWLALIVESEAQRAILVFASFVAYAFASLDQLTWLKDDTQRPTGNRLASGMLVSQVVLFCFYGVVYLVAVFEYCTPDQEQVLYTFSDAFAKVGHAAVLLAARRQHERQALGEAHQQAIAAEHRAWQAAEDLARLVDTANAPIFCTDSSQKVTLWNATASRLFGFSSQEALGQPLDKLLAPQEEKIMDRLRQSGLTNSPAPKTPQSVQRQELQEKVRKLTAYCADSSSGVRAGAVQALGLLCEREPVLTPQALAAVEKCVQDPFPHVRERAVLALRCCGLAGPAAARRANQSLGVALRDQDPQVRAKAAEIVNQLDEARP